QRTVTLYSFHFRAPLIENYRHDPVYAYFMALALLFRPRRRAYLDAHLLMPPLRWRKSLSNSFSGLYFAAYRKTRDHLLRVLSSAFLGSAVHAITAANGSSGSANFESFSLKARSA